MAYGVRRRLGYERPTARNGIELPPPARTEDGHGACLEFHTSL
jgi:hypothetical protein